MAVPFVDHGRDANGADCWGWVRMVARQEKGWRWPSLDAGYESTEDRDDIAVMTAAEVHRWEEIDPRQIEPFDVVSLAIGGRACHVGLHVGNGWLAHLERGMGHVTVERLDCRRWRDRIAGVYRWLAQP